MRVEGFTTSDYFFSFYVFTPPPLNINIMFKQHLNIVFKSLIFIKKKKKSQKKNHLTILV